MLRRARDAKGSLAIVVRVRPGRSCDFGRCAPCAQDDGALQARNAMLVILHAAKPTHPVILRVAKPTHPVILRAAKRSRRIQCPRIRIAGCELPLAVRSVVVFGKQPSLAGIVRPGLPGRAFAGCELPLAVRSVVVFGKQPSLAGIVRPGLPGRAFAGCELPLAVRSGSPLAQPAPEFLDAGLFAVHQDAGAVDAGGEPDAGEQADDHQRQ